MRFAVNGGAWTTAVLYMPARSIALPVRSATANVAVQLRAMDGLGTWGPGAVVSR